MTARSLLILACLLAACGHAADRTARAPAAGASPASTPPEPSFTHRRGVVVNHWLAFNYDEVHSYGGAWFDPEDVAWIASHGFDHIRFRVSTREWIRADGSLDPAKLAPVDAALAWTAARKLGMTIAITTFPATEENARGKREFSDAAMVADASRIWTLIAQRYASAGDNLRFELVHAPNAQTATGLATFNRQVLAAIRAEAPRRFVYLTVPRMSTDALDGVTLPDERTGLAVDYIEPDAFTFQFDKEIPLVAFPGTGPHMTVADIDADFAKLAGWAAQHIPGRELYVAQWGVYKRADATSQRIYMRTVRAALDRHQLPWAVYDYESGCAMRGENGEPTPAFEGLSAAAAAQR